MKLLVNENLPLPVVEALREVGHDVLWAPVHCGGASHANSGDELRRRHTGALSFPG